MIYYVTGSDIKFKTAQDCLKEHGIDIVQKTLDIKEIQSESIEEIAIDKAKRAFETIKEPLFINDSGWFFAGLNGFPGAYMAYINRWLTADDLINLMKGKDNREVILKQVVVYIDEKGHKILEHDSIGKILEKPSINIGRPSEMVSSFSGDDLALTDQRAKGIKNIGPEQELWSELADWLRETKRP